MPDRQLVRAGRGALVLTVVLGSAYTVERHLLDAAPLLVVHVGGNGLVQKPCFVRAKGVGGGSFKRVDDKDVKLSATEIFELQQALTPQNADRAAEAESGVSDPRPRSGGGHRGPTTRV